jgi:uncharacterized membrane protein HdeD (DUF308 family)
MITIYLVLAMAFGVLIRFLYKLSTSLKTKRRFNWKLSLVASVLSLVTNLFLILVREDISAILPYTYFLAGIYGYLGDSIFRGVTKLSSPKFGEMNEK